MNIDPVDEPGGDGAHADVAARLQATLGGPELDPAVRRRHVQAIRDRAAALPIPAPAHAPAPAPASAGGGWARRLASATAAALVMVMGASGAVAASHGAVPGHALYPVKEVSERLVLAVALPTGLAVDRHLTFADRRLDEAATLVDRDGDPALVAAAIAAHARLMERAGALAGDDREVTGRVEAATLMARRRLASLLEQGLPEVAAEQARAALSASQERLDRRPAVPPPTPGAPPALPRDPEPAEPRPDPPAPTTPPEGTPAPRAPAPRGPPAEPAEPTERANPPANPGPPAQPRERQSSVETSAPQERPARPPQEPAPRAPGPEDAASGPADDRSGPSNPQRLP